MRTAQEARAATIVQIDNIAREFVINEVSNTIEKKINEGMYSLRMPLRGAWGSMENYSPTIIKVLKEKGYKAELCDDAYINISWEE